jgi:hypothetical protein
MPVMISKGDETVIWSPGQDADANGLVDLGNGIVVPVKFTWRWQRPGDHAVEVDVAVIDGEARIDEVRVRRAEGRPTVSAADVQRLPLKSMVERAVALAAAFRRKGGKGFWWWAQDESEEEARSAAAKSATVRRRITDERLREVAEAYERNRRTGGTIEELAEELWLSQPQTYRLLKRARDAGFIPAKDGE